MAKILTMGEMIVEIMREKCNAQLSEPEKFIGPYPSGAPAIFIDTVARLGHSAGIVGGVGNDDFGKCLLDRLKKDGVDCSNVLIDDTTSTGCAFVTYFSDGSRKFIFHIGNTPAAKAKAPKSEDLKDVKYFHIMGCSLMASYEFGQEIVNCMKKCAQNGAKISFDPNIRPELLNNEKSLALVKEVMDCVNIFMPGVSELLMLTRATNIDEAVKACFENRNLEILVLKNGSKGCKVYTRENEYSFGVYKMAEVDATGAGDSFDGAFICGLAEGLDMEEIIKRASAAAALNISAFGPMEGKISKENIKKIMEEIEVI